MLRPSFDRHASGSLQAGISRYTRTAMKKVLEYLELILTAVGVVVVAVVFALFRNVAAWKAAAISAVGVGVLHGIIFFIVRSAQRRLGELP